MKDEWIVSDDIRFMPAEFRPIAATDEVATITIRGGDSNATFRGSSLLAAVETARVAHRQRHHSSAPPIFSRAGRTYRWWDGTESTSQAGLDDRIRRYLSELYAVPTRNVQIKHLAS